MPSLTSLFVAAAGISTALAATGCNPSYNYTEPSCINDCKLQAGQSISPDYTTDSASANFLTSISFQCDKSSPNYIPYMTAAGICFTSCNFNDQQAFVTNYQLECQWWQEHGNNSCANVTINDTNSVSSSTSGSSGIQLSTLGTVLALAGGIGIVSLPGLF
ncbi:hypothetical protein VKS41_002168 [Umbelopsis sp. WA50703]